MENGIMRACATYMQDFTPNFNPKNVLLYAMKNFYKQLVPFTQMAEQAKNFEWPKRDPTTADEIANTDSQKYVLSYSSIL